MRLLQLCVVRRSFNFVLIRREGYTLSEWNEQNVEVRRKYIETFAFYIFKKKYRR